MNKLFFIILVYLCCCFSSCSEKDDDARRNISFNEGWKFSLGDDADARYSQYDDNGWRNLNLPHDWAIEGSFSEDNPSGIGGGALPEIGRAHV